VGRLQTSTRRVSRVQALVALKSPAAGAAISAQGARRARGAAVGRRRVRSGVGWGPFRAAARRVEIELPSSLSDEPRTAQQPPKESPRRQLAVKLK
jgi:hypothetical protein